VIPSREELRTPRISCLIPLHDSSRFLPLIIENIDSHLSIGAEVLISDRHMLDDTIDRLAGLYGGVDAVRLFADNDGAALRLYHSLQSVNRQARADVFEGVVMKRGGSVYPVQLRSAGEESRCLVKHRYLV
jgi:hypothetical protein